MDSWIRESIYWLQLHAPAEVLTILLFMVCAVTILALLKFYGAFGLYVYNSLAIVFANIQVLRFTQYETFSAPVALGTVLFTTTYFVNDVLTEHYGAECAKKSVTLGFWSQVIVTVWMMLALGHPLPEVEQASATILEANSNYDAMLQLFTPSIRILIASLVAYLCSQWLDIYIFNRLRSITKGRLLWFRQNMAMFVSGLFDTFLFSALAWMLLSETAISWHDLFFTYILSAQIMRIILNVSLTPLIYMSYNCVPTKTKTTI